MRITGGLYSGRRIVCPPGVIRPAMDRMRESVFAALGDLSGESFLDLYSGSGIIAIEAASRGATEVHLVESDRRKIPVLKQNVSIVDVPVDITAMKVEGFLKSCAESFDLIFADPPFPQKDKKRILELIDSRGVLRPGGLFMIHYPEEDTLPETSGALKLTDSRKYGRSIVNFYKSTALAQPLHRSRREGS